MRILGGLLLAFLACNSCADELAKNSKYRIRTAVKVGLDGTQYNLNVGSQSKFIVINSDTDKYAIRFLNVYPYNEIINATNRTPSNYKTEKISDVLVDNMYFLERSASNGVPIESRVEQSFGGLVSGPLIVPFKYHLDDESIGGDATIGYYAGVGFDSNFGGISDTYITFTPFISAGLTQVAVITKANDGSIKTDNQSGVTLAVGLLIKNWDSVNIGLVYGQDRIGDKTWTHEGEGWLSISVGWAL
ncbi:hypothetical protein FK216_06175 [Moraxellaceae bacterium AER2_44_116]|nr:hypothetical protein [Moraxellaceae bacterium]TQC98442.1 hypothetical protein FK216_06175 [Moraxellaceae bacterium AER2_44_116]